MTMYDEDDAGTAADDVPDLTAAADAVQEASEADSPKLGDEQDPEDPDPKD